MAQFDAYLLPDSTWVVSVQSDLLPIYATTLVVPLVTPDDDAAAMARLNLILKVSGRRLVLAPQLASALPTRLLGSAKTSLAGYEYEIKAALDMLISGY